MIIQRIVEAAAKVLGGNFQARIFFLHIPKCGGTSIFNAIRDCYNFVERRRGFRRFRHEAAVVAARTLDPSEALSGAADDYRELKLGESPELLTFAEPILLYFLSEKISKFVNGHFSFTELAYRNFHPEFTFLTMLRDPIKRWISDYDYNRYATRKIRAELREYIKSDYARSQGSEIVKYIGGLSETGDYVSPEAVQRAKRNLDKFDIVGCLEYPEDFCLKFNERLGARLKLPTLNESRASDRPPTPPIDKEIEEEIGEICKPDLEVYRYAVERFVKR
jgi:hypothetical protein